MKDREKVFSEGEVRNWCFQVFQGLAYMHQRGYFHRDLKPENLLVTKDIIKIADFGLAREISSQPPYTEYVSTRWYRAPEVLLQSYMYSSKVDMWAMGAIMAELFSLRPLFPGASEADEIYKICGVIGSPTIESWADGLKLARDINYQFPQFAGVHLSAVIPSASDDAVSLIKSLCSWDPCKRPTAAEALQHPFFQTCFYIPPSLRTRAVSRTPPSAGTRGALDQQGVRRYSGALPNSKLTNNFSSPKLHPPLASGVQRKLDMVNQNGNKNEKSMNTVKQPKFRQPGKDSPTSMNKGRNARAISETTDRLANMNVGSGTRRHSIAQHRPPPMKAGVNWISESGNFMLRPAQPIPTGRTFSRKVAG
ncbi:hypothetical protein PIB30_118199 [Stylosanthes scabra]|uniref:Protein kinase domain-containing protein n=1 Tax=Stylosanthes scabra TaxID=79078 RepID=A0ABU6T8Y3_9FABA|nr:hypothetical protein [Stylosanthes scabra]